MKPWMRFGLSLALVAGVAACSDDPTGPDFDSTFTSGDAYGIATGMVLTAEQGMETMHWGTPEAEINFAPAVLPARAGSHRPMGTSHLPRLTKGMTLGAYLSALQLSAPGCSVSGSGADGDPYSPYDGNENGVPDDYLITIACSDIDSIGEGVTVNYTEHHELRVKERTDILYGWNASVKESWTGKWSDGSDRYNETQDFTETLAVTHEDAKYTQKGSWHEEGLDGDVPYDSEGGGELTLAFTAGEIPIDLNTLYPPGTATLNGRIYMTSLEGPNLDWHIETDRPLGWDPECADLSGQPFTSGRITASLNGDYSKAVEVTAQQCDGGWGLAIYGDSDEEEIPVTLHPRAFSVPRR